MPKRQRTESAEEESKNEVSEVPQWFNGNKAFVTQPAPEFTADCLNPDETFGKVSLSDFKGQYLVLFFYPLDFTFVCPTEICAFSEAAQKFKDIGCGLVGASIDSQFSHLAWVKTSRKEGGLGGIEIPLIADVTKELSRKYGVLIEGGISLRGLFIIDKKGVIRHITKNDPPVGRNVDEVLRLVQGYQFTDEHGEVCPANWRPGKKTMKPTPTESKEYFAEVNK